MTTSFQPPVASHQHQPFSFIAGSGVFNPNRLGIWLDLIRKLQLEQAAALQQSEQQTSMSQADLALQAEALASYQKLVQESFLGQLFGPDPTRASLNKRRIHFAPIKPYIRKNHVTKVIGLFRPNDLLIRNIRNHPMFPNIVGKRRLRRQIQAWRLTSKRWVQRYNKELQQIAQKLDVSYTTPTSFAAIPKQPPLRWGQLNAPSKISSPHESSPGKLIKDFQTPKTGVAGPLINDEVDFRHDHTDFYWEHPFFAMYLAAADPKNQK